MNYREQFYEGEIDGKALLDVIDEKEAEAQALREEPDWSGSKTLCSEMWKSPVLSKQDRLLIADGAIDFRNRVIANLREQLEALRARVVVPDEYAEFEAWLEREKPAGCIGDMERGWMERARLNGRAVSEGLLRNAKEAISEYAEGIKSVRRKIPEADQRLAELGQYIEELGALLGEGNEHE